MISSQRLIILVIIMNLVLGTIINIYNNPRGFDETEINTQIEVLEEFETDMESEESVWSSVRRSEGQEEQTIGSSINWGFNIWSILKDGVKPWSIHPDMFTNQIEIIFAYFLITIRSILAGLAVIEGYLLFKNKKTT